MARRTHPPGDGAGSPGDSAQSIRRAPIPGELLLNLVPPWAGIAVWLVSSPSAALLILEWFGDCISQERCGPANLFTLNGVLATAVVVGLLAGVATAKVVRWLLAAGAGR
jgi:hypothetical protein